MEMHLSSSPDMQAALRPSWPCVWAPDWPPSAHRATTGTFVDTTIVRALHFSHSDAPKSSMVLLMHSLEGHAPMDGDGFGLNLVLFLPQLGTQ